MSNYQIIKPGSFEPENHWYPRALNATIHPLVAFFLNLSKSRIIERYCHLHPAVKRSALEELLDYRPRYFRWAGADLINVTDEDGKRQMVIIENNSCPSGQKSMPLLDESREMGGYRKLIEQTFLPSMKGQRMIPEGALAVLSDKNHMECHGYAAALAEIMKHDVYYIQFPEDGWESYLKFSDGILHLKTAGGDWIKIKAAFRYVTQRPWNRIPVHTKTWILNPIISCISGGRNKMIAAKAYDMFNAELSETGLKINTPETIWDVSKNEIPLWVKRLGGQAVVKVPYTNAGQGVFTLVSDLELRDFMALQFEYDRFIVQSLIGNYQWSSKGRQGKLYHVGTIPTHKGSTFVADIRMMVSGTQEGIRPISVYSRRAREPLLNELLPGQDSWDMLGTNLSFRREDGSWDTDTNRLILMDRRDFNKLGLGADDLIEAYIQTVLSMVAIDQMSKTLIGQNGKLKQRLFKSLNDDESLISEILTG